MKKRTVLIFCLFFAVGVRLQAQEKEVNAKDLAAGIDLHIRAGAGLCNPIGGFTGEVEIRKIGGFLDIYGGVANGYSGLDGALPLLGSEGFQWHAGLALCFSKNDYTTSSFHAVSKVSESSSSTTYRGFYYKKPVHESHLFNLDFRVEPTGIMEKSGIDPVTLKSQYMLVPGSSFLIFPGYRYCTDSRSVLEGYADSYQYMFMSFTIGPVFSPDFSKIGGLLDWNIEVGMSENVNLFMAVSLGYVARTNIPKGTIIVSDPAIDDVSEPVTVSGFGDTAIYGYMPWRIMLGLSCAIQLTDGGVK